MNGCLLEHMSRFIGETVTIFTTSGGPSGCGFTGCLFGVNPCFVRLITRFGSEPTNPLSESICGEFDTDELSPAAQHTAKRHSAHVFEVGSVCDIPVDKIASFCHNSV